MASVAGSLLTYAIGTPQTSHLGGGAIGGVCSAQVIVADVYSAIRFELMKVAARKTTPTGHADRLPHADAALIEGQRRNQSSLLIALQILLKLGCVRRRYRVFLCGAQISVCRPRIRCCAWLLGPAVPSYSWSGGAGWRPDTCGRASRSSASLRMGAARRE